MMLAARDRVGVRSRPTEHGGDQRVNEMRVGSAVSAVLHEGAMRVVPLAVHPGTRSTPVGATVKPGSAGVFLCPRPGPGPARMADR